MKIEIESTDVVTAINGTPVRLWTGWAEGGIRVRAFVALVGVRSGTDTDLAAPVHRGKTAAELIAEFSRSAEGRT